MTDCWENNIFFLNQKLSNNSLFRVVLVKTCDRQVRRSRVNAIRHSIAKSLLAAHKNLC